MNRPILSLWNKTLFKIPTTDFMKLLSCVKKAECWRIDAFELWCWRRLEGPLDCKEIQPVHPKRHQSCIFIGRTDAEAGTPILWSPNAKNWLIWKDPDAGKDWSWEEKGKTEDEMVGWHHQLNGHEWVNSGSWWWTGKPGMLQSLGSQRVGHNWVTELNWTFMSGQSIKCHKLPLFMQQMKNHVGNKKGYL